MNISKIKKQIKKISNKDVSKVLIQGHNTVNKGVKEDFAQEVKIKETLDTFRDKKWNAERALSQTVEKIIMGESDNKKDELIQAFDSYRDLLISEILKSEEAIKDEAEDESESDIIL